METLTGVGRLVRFTARRERVRLAVWILALVGIVTVSAASLPPVYPDQATVDSYAALMDDNPAFIAFAGPGYGFDDPSIGNILVNEVQLWGAVAMALMSIFLLTRSTRIEEDLERADLIRSTVVGRHSPLTAAVIVVAAANVVVGVLCAASFALLDYEPVGSVALAASFVAVGLVFTGVAAVAVQVASTARAALGGAGVALGGAFVLRAVGDIGDNALRWSSPIGWAQSVRAFAGERWEVLVLCVAATTALIGLAYWLSTRRDLGSGLVAAGVGPAEASPRLRSPIGLAVRLQRGYLLGWAIGLFIVAGIYGSIGEDVEQMIEDNPIYADILTQTGTGSPADSFFATATVMLALIVSGYTISSILRLRTEERAGRAELVLASKVGRTRWAMSHVAVATGGTAVVMGIAGVGMGLSYALVSDDAEQVWRLTEAALSTTPAILVLGAAAVMFIGWLPRAAMAAWAGLAAAAVIDVLGELLRLPHWLRQVSPFAHLPGLPADDLRALPVLALLTVAGTLTAVGLVGLGRRDLTPD